MFPTMQGYGVVHVHILGASILGQRHVTVQFRC